MGAYTHLFFVMTWEPVWQFHIFNEYQIQLMSVNRCLLTLTPWRILFANFQDEDETCRGTGRKRAAPTGRGRGSTTTSKRGRRSENTSSSLQKLLMSRDDDEDDDDDDMTKKKSKSNVRVSHVESKLSCLSFLPLINALQRRRSLSDTALRSKISALQLVLFPSSWIILLMRTLSLSLSLG